MPDAVVEHAQAVTMPPNWQAQCAYWRAREVSFILDGLLGRAVQRNAAGIRGASTGQGSLTAILGVNRRGRKIEAAASIANGLLCSFSANGSAQAVIM